GGKYSLLGGRQCRHSVCAQLCTRWLHDRLRRSELRHQPDALREASVQFHSRQRSGRRIDSVGQRNGGASGGAGQQRCRVYRLCKSQSGQDQLCFGWRRHVAASVRRVAQNNDRHQSCSCAVPGRGVRVSRPDGRPGADAVRQHSQSIGHIRTGKVRKVGVTGAKRVAAIPDVPTIGETVPGYEVSIWYGMAAPRGTPPEIVEKLNQAVNAGLADPKLQARLAELGGEPMPMTPAEFGKLVAEETEKWAKVIRAANIKAE